MNNGFNLFRFSLLSLPASFFPPFSLSLVPSIEHRSLWLLLLHAKSEQNPWFLSSNQSDSFSTWRDSFLLQVRLLSKSPTTLVLR
ncbi:hypothetical protein I3842_16G066000 [Carya illinoinensis]|uniref:Uncharacterized protein n=1 Tax=Carya illinoinensis TaxID=32201 RepID=A0A922A0G7_CARIL|nr:hypothetical protein I3842_16G066000 [Carya illinoinensis]